MCIPTATYKTIYSDHFPLQVFLDVLPETAYFVLAVILLANWFIEWVVFSNLCRIFYLRKYYHPEERYQNAATSGFRKRAPIFLVIVFSFLILLVGLVV